MIIKRTTLLTLSFSYLVITSGCDLGDSGASNFDPAKAGQALVTQLDKDGNNSISPNEMTQIPALKNAFDLFDLEGDSEVSAQDATRRFQLWATAPDRSMPFSCLVMLGSSPLKGATVRLVPEAFLGSSLQEATGTTDERGIAQIRSIGTDPEKNPGVRYGIYKVEITHPSKTIPSRYNKETELGQEVAPESYATENVVYRIKT